MQDDKHFDVIIVGAGIAGLSCARTLHRNNISFAVLERSDRPGGRIKTDCVEGFQLDHGFQVLQTGYPDIGHYLNLDDLRISPFPAGVRIRRNGRFHVLADPRSHYRHLPSTLAAPVGTIGDRVRLLRLTRTLSREPMEDIFTGPEEKTIDFLRSQGFSANFISSFFTPFFAGACLETGLEASSRVLKYIMRLFATGTASLPADGMAAIVRQFASALPGGSIHYNREVTHIEAGAVYLADGTSVRAKTIVVAVAEPELAALVKIAPPPRSVGEACLYFSSAWQPPFTDPFLVLNGDNRGPINNIAFPSLVSPSYAPRGKTLIAVVVLGKEVIAREDLENLVRGQCTEWFGAAVADWRHLKSYRIHHALPKQTPPTASPYRAAQLEQPGLVVCGEHHSLPGLQWAMMSGAMAADRIIAPPSGRSDPGEARQKGNV